MDARIKPGHDGCISWARSRRASHPHRPQNFQTTKTIQTQLRNPATLRARGVHLSLAPKEGVGNAGCPLHPRPRVHFVLVESTRVTTSTPESPGIPARNGLTAYVGLSPVTGLFCHRHLADIVLSLPGWAKQNSARLDASVGMSGPHDFAVRNNISRPRAVDRSQVFRPALRSHRAQEAAASTASRALRP